MTEPALKEPKDTTLLVVDDESDLREAMVSFLKRRGYRVLGAENGHDAFAIIEREPVDLVLTDVRMPNGDGIELLDRVKSRDHVTPVVMLITGYADLTPEEAFDRGADAIFPKPFDRGELLEAIRRALAPMRARWARRLEGFEIQAEIELEFPALGITVAGKALRLGRGGMFVAIEKPIHVPNARLRFRISFAKEPAFHVLSGYGVVRWARAKRPEGLPAGCGIEFLFLDDETREQVVAFIESLKTKSFIPKTMET